MKWYKHISDSLDDPFIFDLIKKHDAEGYLVFFGILEIYAREFKIEPGWKLTLTLDYLRGKLQRTRNKPILNILTSIQVSLKWEIDLIKDDSNGKYSKVTIFIPKFTQLLDEWTTRKLGSYSGVTPEILGTDKDKDKDKDKDTNINKGVKDKKIKEYTPEFLSFWNSYPRKSGSKKAAFDNWGSLGSDLPSIDIILSSIMIQKGWRKNSNGEFRPEWKDPERWLKNKMWESDFEAEVKKAIGVPKDDFRKCRKCGTRTFKGDLNETGFCIKCEGKE